MSHFQPRNQHYQQQHHQQQHHQQQPQQQNQPQPQSLLTKATTASKISLQNVLSDISFCDKQCSNVNNNTTKADILNELETFYGIQIIEKNFVVLNPHIIKNVSFHQHLLSVISVGNPYLLYLTKIDGVNCCLYIDRKMKTGYFYPKIHCVKYKFNNEIFEDTIFSGELIRDVEKRWSFVLNDILVHRGTIVKQQNILSRFELMYSIMTDFYTADSVIEPCPIFIKRLFMYKDIASIFRDFIPKLSYNCRGIMFYTLNSKNTNYAYLFSREQEIPILSLNEIDEILKDTNPELFDTSMDTSIDSRATVDLDNSLDNRDGIFNKDTLEQAFESIYGDGYKKELYGESYECATADIIPNYKPIHIPSLQSVENTQSTEIAFNIVIKDRIEEEKPNDILENPDYGVFRILKTQMADIFNLYVMSETNELIKLGVAYVSSLKTSKFLHELLKGDKLDISVVASYQPKFQKWLPLRATTLEISSQSTIFKIMNNLDKQYKLSSLS